MFKCANCGSKDLTVEFYTNAKLVREYKADGTHTDTMTDVDTDGMAASKCRDCNAEDSAVFDEESEEA